MEDDSDVQTPSHATVTTNAVSSPTLGVGNEEGDRQVHLTILICRLRITERVSNIGSLTRDCEGNLQWARQEPVPKRGRLISMWIDIPFLGVVVNSSSLSQPRSKISSLPYRHMTEN